MRQAFEGLRSEIDALRRDQRRSAHAPENGSKPRINAEFTVANFLTVLAMIGGAIYAYGQFAAAMTNVENTIRGLKYEIVQAKTDRDILRSQRDEQIKTINGKIAEMSNFGLRIGQAEGQIGQIVERLNRSTDQRIEADKEMAKTLSDIGTSLKVQANELKQLASAVERMEARSRRGRDPFERQMMGKARFPILEALYRPEDEVQILRGGDAQTVIR